MKKLLGGITFLLIALLLASPWFVGGQIETYYASLVEEMQKRSPQIDLSDRTYKRGWFSSTITGTVAFTDGLSVDEMPLAVSYKSRVTHGPVFWSALAESPLGLALDRSKVWLTPKTEAPLFQEILFDLPRFTCTSRIHFKRNIDTRFAMDTYEKEVDVKGDPLAITFKGLSGSGTYNPQTKEAIFQALMPHLDMKGEGKAHLSLEGFSITGSAQGNEGEFTYGLKKLLMVNKKERISLEEAYFSGGNKEAEEMYNAFFKCGFKALSSGEKTYAPASLHLTFSNLDKSSFDALAQSLNEATAKSQQMGSDMLGMVVMGKLMETLPDILKRSPKIELKELLLGTPEKETLTARGYATIDGQQASKLVPGPMLIQAVDAEFSASLPRGFAEKEIGLSRLSMLEGQKVLIFEEKSYTMKASAKKGAVTLNGVRIM